MKGVNDVRPGGGNMENSCSRCCEFTTFPPPLLRRVASFSIVKWPHFRLSKFVQKGTIGPVFDYQMALFSIDKNTG
jgi:hypothetical protein